MAASTELSMAACDWKTLMQDNGWEFDDLVDTSRDFEGLEEWLVQDLGPEARTMAWTYSESGIHRNTVHRLVRTTVQMPIGIKLRYCHLLSMPDSKIDMLSVATNWSSPGLMERALSLERDHRSNRWSASK